MYVFYKEKELQKLLICLILLLSYYCIDLNMKICLCTIGKRENLYIREYITHYQKYGVDKIFIYDNNNINGEKFENVIKDYIENGFVKIINIRGKFNMQIKALQDCYKNNYNKYNWLLFFDMDEFIYLKNYGNIKKYLADKKFKKCETIQLNMYFHNDNNLFYYSNKSLFKRFPKKVKRKREFLKSILRGNINFKLNCFHILNEKLKSCNGFGNYNLKEKQGVYTYNPDYTYNYIDHFCFKSLEEFINKLNRGDAFHGGIDRIKFRKINWYFSLNEITSKKINYIEKYTKLNLSNYKNKLANKSTKYK